MRRAIFVAMALVMVTAAGRVQAATIIDANEMGGGVFISGAGTLDISSLTQDTTLTAATSPFLNPRVGVLRVGPGSPAPAPADGYEGGISGGDSFFFGPGDIFRGGVGTGDVFGPSAHILIVPDGYTSGSFLSGTATFAGETFASLGLTQGTYIWSWGTGGNADSLTLNIGQTATIPEPSTCVGLISLGLVGAGVQRRRRNRAA